MSKQDGGKIQSFVLSVNVHCDGCKQKIKKQLKKIAGVYNISMDAEQGKVTVLGTVDPSTLIKKLEKSGKHAVLCGSQKGASNNIQNPPKNMFQNIPLDNFKVGKDNKSQKGWSGKDQPKQHLPQQQQQQQQLYQQQIIQQLKGNIKDQKVPSKDPRTVKFNLPEEDFGASDSDSYDDEFDDDFDDEYDDDDEYYDDEEFGGPSKTIPIAGKGSNGMMNGQSKNDKGQKGEGGGGKNGKKGEVFDVMKDMGGKKEKNEKHGGKDKKGSGGNGTGKIGGLISILKGVGGKNDVKSAGKKGGGCDGKNHKNGGGGGNKGSGDGGNGKGNGKKGGGKNEGSQGMRNAFPDQNVLKQVKGVGDLNQQMGSFPAVQGQHALAAAMNGGGYYPGMNQGMGMGMGPPAANSYNNQQYMAMMMNQQRANPSSEMLHPMMYSRAPPPMGFMPPPMPSHPMADPYTHIFSDENTGSCSIM